MIFVRAGIITFFNADLGIHKLLQPFQLIIQ